MTRRAPHTPDVADYIDELSIVELLWRRRWIMIACVAASLICGLIYLQLATPLYKSTARVYVQPQELTGSPSASSPFADATTAAHVELLTSDTVLSAALSDPQAAGAVAAFAGEMDAVRALRNRLGVRAGEKERIVSVSIDTANPQDSALIVNRVVEAYVAQQRKRHEATAAGAIDRLRGELGESVADAAGAMTERDPQEIAQRLQELEKRLTDAEIATSEAQSLVEASKRTDDIVGLQQLLSAGGIEGARDVMLVQNELLSLLSAVEQERERLGRLGPNHPSVTALDRQATAVQRRISDWRSATIGGIRLRLREHAAALVRQEAQVRAAVEAHQALAATIVRVPVVLIDPAHPADIASSPNKKQVLGLSLAMGLVLGGALVLALDHRAHASAARATLPSTELHSPEDLEVGATPDTLLLGVVPETKSSADPAPAWDTTASSIHHVRAMLQIRARNLGHRTFAVTSPRRGAGKTSVTVGLATSMAISGTRTLVIDCDLASRMPQTQNGTNTMRGAPLDQVLHGRGYVRNGDAKDALPVKPYGLAAMIDGLSLEQCLTRGSVPNLDVLPAGLVQADHISRMSDRFIRKLLDEVAPAYDMVLIDTGPVPGSVEALMVCSRVDGVLVVAQHGEERKQYDKTISYLRVLGARLAGTIFNRFGGSASATAEPAGFIPHARPRELKTNEKLGSGLLAATVLNGSAKHDSAMDDDKDIVVSDLGDLVDVLKTPSEPRDSARAPARN